jgi:hypothetical protein
MRVAAQIEVNTMLRGVFEHLWRMHQKDLEGIRRHTKEGSR